MLNRPIFYPLIITLVGVLFAGTMQAAILHQPWNELLERYVKNGAVDYQGFKEDESELDSYLEFLDQTSPETLGEADQLAFYINAYNAYTVKLILMNFSDGEPVSSIRKIGGFFSGPWDIEFVKVGGKVYTLDNIEHDIIRPQFKEPRIHFAVNCASISCPPLIPEAYEGDILDLQLERSTRDFLGDVRFNHLKEDTLYVSSIFKWYREDFDDDPVAFFLAHAEGDLLRRIKERRDKLSVKYLDYDWSLNGR